MIYQKKLPATQYVMVAPVQERKSTGELVTTRPPLYVSFLKSRKNPPEIDTEEIAKAYVKALYGMGKINESEIKSKTKKYDEDIQNFIERHPDYQAGHIYKPISNEEMLDRYHPEACPFCEAINIPGRVGLREHIERVHGQVAVLPVPAESTTPTA